MSIPEGGIIVKHSTYASHLALHELGLIEETTDDKGEVVEVEVYRKEVDADSNGKIHPLEVWDFFIQNMDSLNKEGVINVLVSLRRELQESPRLPPPESKIFKTYQALFSKALQNKDPEIQSAALEALEILTPGKIYPARVESLPEEKKLISAGVIQVTIESSSEKTLDANGDNIIGTAEVELFFFNNINRLPEEEVKKVISAMAGQISLYQSVKYATFLGLLAVVSFKYAKDYKGTLIKASQADIPHLRQAGTEAIKVFLAAEQAYYQAHPEEKPAASLPYSLIPPPQDLQTCLERTTLPEGYIELPIAEVTEKRTGKTRKAIIDGDTIRVELEDKIAGVRFKGVNTTEFGKGPTLEARLERAEPGAIKAWEELKGLLAAAGYKVYVRPERLDHYGRFVSQVFVKAPGGKFIDVEAFLVKRGLGMAYFVQVTDPQAYSCLLALQAQAQQERKGLWSLPEFLDRNDPEKKKFKPLHITSFHPKGARDKGIEEPLYNEYFRIVNISGQPINLMDYVIFNKVSGEKVVLPYFIVPPGRTVKIASGDIETNADPDNPEKDLVLSLLFKKPFWENKEKYGEGTCLIIQDLNSRTVDASAKYGYEGCE